MKIVMGILICSFLLSGFNVFSQEIDKIKITELEKTIKKTKEPMIINFWATFCIPCIEEIPYFEELSKKYGVRLLLVSLDLADFYPEKIKKFVAKHQYKSHVSWLDEYDADYFCPIVDSSWSGAIPASLFLNNKTGYRKFIEDQVSREDLEKTILALLDKSN